MNCIFCQNRTKQIVTWKLKCSNCRTVFMLSIDGTIDTIYMYSLNYKWNIILFLSYHELDIYDDASGRLVYTGKLEWVFANTIDTFCQRIHNLLIFL